MIETSFSPLFVGLGWISMMLLVGVFLRAKIPIIQRFLFPAALIGGALGFTLMSIGTVVSVDYSVFTLAAFHLFSLGFVSIGLTGADDNEGAKKGKAKQLMRGGLWMALIWTACLTMQCIVGGGIIYGLNTFMDPIYEGIGFLAGHGFTQGPGQTVAIATTWETTYKIPDAISVGLSFAAIGFFISAIVGVPLANWGVRKGYAHSPIKELSKDFLSGLFFKGEGTEAGKQTTQPSNIDAFAFHLALLLGVYFVTYMECVLVNRFLPPALKPLTYGFIFMWGMLNGMLARTLLKKFGSVHLIDNNIQRRLTGTTVDFMIVATLMAVKIATVLQYIVPILLICIVVSIITFGFILYFGKRSGDYPLERVLAMFGYCTGTAASGLLLLRIVDPEFKTPVSTEIGFMNIFAAFTMPHLIPMHMTLPILPMGVSGMMGINLINFLIMIILLKVLKFWNKPSW